MTEAQTDRAVEIYTANLISPVEFYTENSCEEYAQESADLMSLEDMSSDWDLQILIEKLPASELKTVMASLRRQIVREIVEQGALS